MKRSDALKEIQSVLENFYHKKSEEFEVLASVLLNEIEHNPKLGMLPPTVKLEATGVLCSIEELCDSTNLDYTFEWEEEDLLLGDFPNEFDITEPPFDED